MDSQGKLVVFSAPSGAGKTTIVKYLKQQYPNLEFSVSAATRAPREGEVHGRDYYFMSDDEFMQKVQEGAFVEWEEVYTGNKYGTLKSELERIWNHGNHVLFDIDVVGGLNIKSQFSDQCLAIFVQPPSLEVLKQRLIGRGTEEDAQVQTRYQKAASEMKYAERFDYLLLNGDLDKACQEISGVVETFISR